MQVKEKLTKEKGNHKIDAIDGYLLNHLLKEHASLDEHKDAEKKKLKEIDSVEKDVI